MNWFINNREFIKNLAVNTGTSQNPTWTTICTTSEITISPDFESKDFYVWCDAIQRSILTGSSVTLSGTLKLDMNNAGDRMLLAKIHTLLTSGTITQFNNDEIQFDLLTGVSSTTLTYTKYKVPVVLTINDMGGNAEDETEFSFEMKFNGTASVVTSS